MCVITHQRLHHSGTLSSMYPGFLTLLSFGTHIVDSLDTVYLLQRGAFNSKIIPWRSGRFGCNCCGRKYSARDIRKVSDPGVFDNAHIFGELLIDKLSHPLLVNLAIKIVMVADKAVILLITCRRYDCRSSINANCGIIGRALALSTLSKGRCRYSAGISPFCLLWVMLLDNFFGLVLKFKHLFHQITWLCFLLMVITIILLVINLHGSFSIWL